MVPQKHSLNFKLGLPKTWPSFFGRFGALNPLQKAVIPTILAGHNVIVSSPAATGKTEAVFAPLIERMETPFPKGLSILYVSPTRALVNNIYLRLRDILGRCGLESALRTGERPDFSLNHPEQVLFTTPESLDSMLCRSPSLWKGLRAIVLDEIHLIDGTYRGDQLRVLIERLRQGHTSGPLQYAALSATLFDPQVIALRYFQPVVTIKNEETRPIHLTLFPDIETLIRYIRDEKMHKVLIFANSRREVEKLGTDLKTLWPKDRIVIHHGSLSKQMRETAERALREWRWGLCVATMTLEIGIDIGDFDGVVCYHPPLTPSSFQQRIGRGCRREKVIRALGIYSSEGEKTCFEIYEEMANQGQVEATGYIPDISVAVQQLFSYLFSHPRGEDKAILGAILLPLIDQYQLGMIINHLMDQEFVSSRKERLYATEKLMNLGEQGLIHSNIPSYKQYQVFDQAGNQKIGEIGLQAVPGTVFVLGGKVWEAVSLKGHSLYVRIVDQKPKFRHFKRKSPIGAFARFLPEGLRDFQGKEA